MSRNAAIVGGLMLGAAIGLMIVFVFTRGRPEAPVASESDDRQLELVPETPGEESAAAAGVRKLPVTIYQRAATATVMLRPVGAQIVWFDSPVDRARQLVRMVIDGVRAEGAVQPAPKGLRYNEVYVDDRRIAWVDLAGDGVLLIDGADMEQALVGCLARTLVENLEEVQRVGILVDGEPRRTLAGHLDLSRTFNGREWPTLSGRAGRSGGSTRLAVVAR